MSMKFGRAYCEELGSLVSPYRAREIYTDEDSKYYGKELTFGCEDPSCRVRLTPVGIYMVRKSKRALHFRTKEDHKAGCGLLKPGDGGKVRKPSEREDDYKPTNFPTELDLNPPKRKGGGSSGASGDDGDEGLGGGSSGGYSGGDKRKTNSRTRYLDLVVDCFLSGDEDGKKGNLTIAGKTKPFGRFFKKVQYFGDEVGLIYYGPIDDLKIYNGKGIGLRFADSVWVEKRPYRIWVHISQEVIDGSGRKKSFVAEMAELKRAVDAKEEVVAFFVGAYPLKTTVEMKGGATFDLYSAELSSVNHLSLAFARS
ncbi:hypothetical protein ACXIUT_27125 [Achromobacter denitrificans]